MGMENDVLKKKIAALETSNDVQGLEDIKQEAEIGFEGEIAGLAEQAIARLSSKIEEASTTSDSQNLQVKNLGGNQAIVEERTEVVDEKINALGKETEQAILTVKEEGRGQESGMAHDGEEYIQKRAGDILERNLDVKAHPEKYTSSQEGLAFDKETIEKSVRILEEIRAEVKKIDQELEAKKEERRQKIGEILDIYKNESNVKIKAVIELLKDVVDPVNGQHYYFGIGKNGGPTRSANKHEIDHYLEGKKAESEQAYQASLSNMEFDIFDKNAELDALMQMIKKNPEDNSYKIKILLDAFSKDFPDKKSILEDIAKNVQEARELSSARREYTQAGGYMNEYLEPQEALNYRIGMLGKETGYDFKSKVSDLKENINALNFWVKKGLISEEQLNVGKKNLLDSITGKLNPQKNQELLKEYQAVLQ